jgi:hypothetical protein
MSQSLWAILPFQNLNPFNPLDQLFGNNRLCVEPPSFFCTPFVTNKQNLGLSVCGDAILQIGEECDDGTNTSAENYNHNGNSPVYVDSSKYGPLV